MKRPNVVLICADQWRADCLSIAGHPDVRTPYLDRLASQGARFTGAYSATPTCVPARMALITGMSQTNHRRVGYQDGVDFDFEDTLPKRLSDHGYQTQAIGKMHYSPERARAGFDDVILHDGYLHHSRDRSRPVDFYDDYLPWLREQAGTSAVEDYLDNGLDCNSMVARPWDKAEALHPTNWAVTEAIRWLYRRDVTSPFFLYLSFHRPHAPYDPPAWAFDQYVNKDLSGPDVGDWTEVYEEHRDDHDPTALVALYPADSINRARAGYYGNVTHVDHQIARFLQALAEFGELDNTYVCFVSDHGDMLGDHNLWRKGFPYEASAGIPFILNGPGIPKGKVVESIVELRDVMPTLLECVGITAPDDIDGESVLPLIGMDGHSNEASQWRSHLHGEHTLLGQSLQWIRTETHKYVWHSGDGREQLFDLGDDPKETRDLAALSEQQDVLLACRELLIKELRTREEGFVNGEHLVVGRPVRAVLSVVPA